MAKYFYGPLTKQMQLFGEALEQRPEHAALVGTVIAIWSDIESYIGAFLTYLMQASPAPAMEFYLAVKNQRARKDAVDSTAEFVLSGMELELYQRIRTLTRACEKERDAMAHSDLLARRPAKDHRPHETGSPTFDGLPCGVVAKRFERDTRPRTWEAIQRA